MLALCKRVMKLEPTRRNCTVERTDGIDINAWIMMRARSWYARLLMEAPTGWLPVEDLKDEIAVTNCGDGAAMAITAGRYIRPVEWQLAGWHQSVTTFALPGDAVALMQRNPWTRAGACDPVIVDHGNWLTLYGTEPDVEPTIALARCVALPADGNFVFHQAAIQSLTDALLKD